MVENARNCTCNRNRARRFKVPWRALPTRLASKEHWVRRSVQLFSRLQSVSFCVLRKMITSHKALATNRTHIAFFSRVRAVMSSKFVRASELFLASLPIALERTLTCMCAEMRLEMATLSIFFVAAWVVTSVYFLLLLGSTPRISAPGLLFWFGDRFRGCVVIYIASGNARRLCLH